MVCISRFGLVVIIVILFHAAAQAGAYTPIWINVMEKGVVAHKDSISTSAIQRVIDDCHHQGGGTLYFPPGEYTSGQLYLKSNVSFYFENNATLYASRHINHYKKREGIYEADNQAALPNELALFFGDSVHHVGFFGKGRIHGQALRVWEPLKKVDLFIEKETALAEKSGVAMERYYVAEPKIRLIYINNASYITFRDITLEESPDWTLHLGNTQNVVIDGITILSSLTAGVNSDGIDMDGCRDVRISNCHISTGDDAICLKSTIKNGIYHPCENIVVNNCTLESTSTALKIGTESYGNFNHIIFSNCVIRNSNRGISIVVRDGALVENVFFTNLIIECNRKPFFWWGDGDPIRFILLKRNPDSRLGTIRNIYVTNVVASGQGTSLIQGFNGSPLENIALNNVSLTLNPETLTDKRATDILQINVAKDITLRNVTLGWNSTPTKEPKWNYALRTSMVDGIKLHSLDIKQPINKDRLLFLQNTTGLIIDTDFSKEWIEQIK